METESSTSDGGESTLDRLEASLSADDAQQEPSEPQEQEAQADAPDDVYMNSKRPMLTKGKRNT